MSVSEIKTAISELSPREVWELATWFADYQAKLWDAQIETDAGVDKLDSFAAEALAEYHAGKASEI